MKKKKIKKLVEIWKPIAIPEFTNKYLVSNLGEIKNSITGKILKHQINNRGYHMVTLYNDGHKKSVMVARAVALTFIPNDDPLNKNQVDHKNGNKDKNDVTNLEWVTQSENMTRAYAKNLRTYTFSDECKQKRDIVNRKRLKGKPSLNSKKVAMVDKNTNKILKVFINCKEAALEVGCDPTSIQEVARGKKGRVTTKGYKWKYV